MNTKDALRTVAFSSDLFAGDRGDEAFTRLEADAQVLWAVRVLWAYAIKHCVDVPAPKPHVTRKDKWTIIVGMLNDAGGYGQVIDWQDFERTTPEAVTIAVAEALVAADPSLSGG